MVASFLIKGVVIDFVKDVAMDAAKLMAMESHINDGVVTGPQQVEIIKKAIRANIKKKTGIEVPEGIENHPAFTQAAEVVLKAAKDIQSSDTAQGVETIIKNAQAEIEPLAGQLAQQIKGFDPEKVKSFIDKNAGSAFGAVAEAGKQFEGVKQGFGRFLRGLENRGMK